MDMKGFKPPGRSYEDNTDMVIAYEKKARKWNIWTTIIISLAFLVPLPFARFEAWPSGDVIAEHIIMPWSQFRICYLSFPEGRPVERKYVFTWKGELMLHDLGSTPLITTTSIAPPILKWQESRDIFLNEMFYEGDYLLVSTGWQPFLFWPFRMLWYVT